MRRADISGPTGFCLWCDYPVGSKSTQVFWCSNTCRKEYLERAEHKELRFAIQERDLTRCEECQIYDPQYMIVPRYAVEAGGGAGGVDTVRTLCEQCFLARRGEITSDEVARLDIPDIPALRAAWRSSDRKWLNMRYLLGPTLISGVRWHRTMTEYRSGLHHLGKEASIRNREHFRLSQSTYRWWGRVVEKSKKPHPLAVMTLDSLREQERSCAVWGIHFRMRQWGALG